MKKLKEKGEICMKSAILLTAVYFCVAESELAKAAVSDAIERCLTVVIPSLYAMMIAAVVITKSGILCRIPRFVGRIGRLVFGMDGEALAIFAFSMLAGYPSGTKMITEKHASGEISEKEASVLCGICFGGGPAFVMGCISATLYGSDIAGKIIIVSTVSANILTAFASSFFLRRIGVWGKVSHHKTAESDSLLMESVAIAGRTTGGLCFMITAFSVITAMLDRFGVISAAAEVFSFLTGFGRETSEGFIAAMLDITAVAELLPNNYALLPWLCVIVSFGGICVAFQTAAIVAGRFSLRNFIILRIISASLSFLICRLIMPFMLRDEIIPVSAVDIGVYSAASPVPSVMLLFMTCIIMAEYDKTVKIPK